MEHAADTPSRNDDQLAQLAQVLGCSKEGALAAALELLKNRQRPPAIPPRPTPFPPVGGIRKPPRPTWGRPKTYGRGSGGVNPVYGSFEDIRPLCLTAIAQGCVLVRGLNGQFVSKKLFDTIPFDTSKFRDLLGELATTMDHNSTCAPGQEIPYVLGLDADMRSGKRYAILLDILSSLSNGVSVLYLINSSSLPPVIRQANELRNDLQQVGFTVEGPRRDLRLVTLEDIKGLSTVLTNMDIPTVVVANMDFHRMGALTGLLVGASDDVKFRIFKSVKVTFDEFQRSLTHQEGKKVTEEQLRRIIGPGESLYTTYVSATSLEFPNIVKHIHLDGSVRHVPVHSLTSDLQKLRAGGYYSIDDIVFRAMCSPSDTNVFSTDSGYGFDYNKRHKQVKKSKTSQNRRTTLSTTDIERAVEQWHIDDVDPRMIKIIEEIKGEARAIMPPYVMMLGVKEVRTSSGSEVLARVIDKFFGDYFTVCFEHGGTDSASCGIVEHASGDVYSFGSLTEMHAHLPMDRPLWLISNLACNGIQDYKIFREDLVRLITHSIRVGKTDKDLALEPAMQEAGRMIGFGIKHFGGPDFNPVMYDHPDVWNRIRRYRSTSTMIQKQYFSGTHDSPFVLETADDLSVFQANTGHHDNKSWKEARKHRVVKTTVADENLVGNRRAHGDREVEKEIQRFFAEGGSKGRTTKDLKKYRPDLYNANRARVGWLITSMHQDDKLEKIGGDREGRYRYMGALE